MQMPSITDLEQERLRRERDRIMKAPQLPDIQLTACGLYYTKMKIGSVELQLRTELGEDRNGKAVLDVWDAGITKELSKLFPDPVFVERVFDQVVKALEENLRKENGTLVRHHKRNVSG